MYIIRIHHRVFELRRDREVSEEKQKMDKIGIFMFGLLDLDEG